MGWGNNQVEYGAAPIYGGVVYEDTRAIEAWRKEANQFKSAFERMFISNRAWIIVAYTLANSENREKRSKEDMKKLHSQATTLLEKYVKQKGFKQFYEDPPQAISLEP
jgi:hypothetical protein